MSVLLLLLICRFLAVAVVLNEVFLLLNLLLDHGDTMQRNMIKVGWPAACSQGSSSLAMQPARHMHMHSDCACAVTTSAEQHIPVVDAFSTTSM